MRSIIVTREQGQKYEATVDIVKSKPRTGRCYIHHEILRTTIGRLDEHLTVDISKLTLETPHDYQFEVIRYHPDLFDSPLLFNNAEAAAAWFCWGRGFFGVMLAGVHIDSINRVVTLRVLRDAKVDVAYNEEEQSNEIHHQK